MCDGSYYFGTYHSKFSINCTLKNYGYWWNRTIDVPSCRDVPEVAEFLKCLQVVEFLLNFE